MPSEKLTPGQRQFLTDWPGAWVVAYGPADAAEELRMEFEFRMSRPL